MAERLVIIDSNSILHRAFHALPPLKTKKGETVNALYGFLLVFFKAIREFQPDYLVACFDFPGPTFRHKKFREYKISRPPAPEEFYQQIPKVKEILKAFGVPIFEKKGFEADDIIGTISQLASKMEKIILSGDLDTLQLVDSQTKVSALRKGTKEIFLYDQDFIKENYQGLRPGQLIDFKALVGDPSDNIPGVPGIGIKTALKLLNQFGNIENLYQSLIKKEGKIKPKLGEILLKGRERAFLSKELAKIKRDVQIDFNLEKSSWGKYDKEKVNKILKKFEFFSLIDRLPSGQKRLPNFS